MNKCSRRSAALAVTVVSFATGSTLAQTTERVSVSSLGVQAAGQSFAGNISGDGRFTTFVSDDQNLVAGVGFSGNYDVFVRDRQGATTELVSLSLTGQGGNNDSTGPWTSLDGRFVAFASSATNLIANDLNARTDIFVRDRSSGTTECASLSTSGAQPNGHCTYARISGDGRFVTFTSSATNLVAGDTNASSDIFLRDRSSGTTDRVSVATGGAQASAQSLDAAISADGRWIAFLSFAPDLVLGDANGTFDVFVRDCLNGTTELASVHSSEVQANSWSNFASISGDGRFVSFESYATNLVAGGPLNTYDVFVRDRQSGTTERVSLSTSGTPGNGHSWNATISVDGRFVSFSSYASNLVTGDTNGMQDIFLHDRSFGTTARLNLATGGAQANNDCTHPTMSTDGRFVAFSGFASNLVTGDTNTASDAFVRDRGAPPVVYCTSSTSSNGCSASIAASANPSVSLASPCNLAVTGVDGQKAGLLFYGIDNSGFTPPPWAPGSTSFLCVKPPTQRTPIQDSGGTSNACDGSYALDWNAYQTTHPMALGAPWSAGTKVHAQAWFRDPAAVKSTNLSDAVELTYVP